MEKNPGSNPTTSSEKNIPGENSPEKKAISNDTILFYLMYQNCMLLNTYYQNLIAQQQGKTNNNDENDIVSNYISMRKAMFRRIILFIFIVLFLCICFFIGYKFGYRNGMYSNVLKL